MWGGRFPEVLSGASGLAPGAVSGRPVQGRISMSWGVIMTSSTRPALAMALEDMVIRREMAMTEFKIMVK